jgi:hypothetical protein
MIATVDVTFASSVICYFISQTFSEFLLCWHHRSIAFCRMCRFPELCLIYSKTKAAGSALIVNIIVIIYFKLNINLLSKINCFSGID